MRQALVCIQASFPNRFATAAQSSLLAGLNSPHLSHFLMAAQGSEFGEDTPVLESNHLLMTIEQLDDDQTDWKNQVPAGAVKIAAWLNSADPLACSQMFWLLAAGASQAKALDLGQLNARGALQTTLKDSGSQSWMQGERVHLFERFTSDAEKIFRVEKKLVSTDGCTVSLFVEGETTLSSEKAFEAAIKILKNSERHMVIVNYIGGQKPRLQCVFLTPMRLPLKELQTSSLKGFVLLRDIKETVKLAKSVLAS
ncbi:MAG: hypothetical protein EOP10_19795 [Proteobacteria bacterium]|nr:MAG: hypothetical protein EOP10_19795 [Pseudomonadota bacterium]